MDKQKYMPRIIDRKIEEYLNAFGAGRIAKLRMRPMSLYESGDSSGMVSLEALCQNEITPVLSGEVTLQKLIELIVRGGWPGSGVLLKSNWVPTRLMPLLKIC